MFKLYLTELEYQKKKKKLEIYKFFSLRKNFITILDHIIREKKTNFIEKEYHKISNNNILNTFFKVLKTRRINRIFLFNIIPSLLEHSTHFGKIHIKHKKFKHIHEYACKHI